MNRREFFLGAAGIGSALLIPDWLIPKDVSASPMGDTAIGRAVHLSLPIDTPVDRLLVSGTAVAVKVGFREPNSMGIYLWPTMRGGKQTRDLQHVSLSLPNVTSGPAHFDLWAWEAVGPIGLFVRTHNEDGWPGVTTAIDNGVHSDCSDRDLEWWWHHFNMVKDDPGHYVLHLSRPVEFE